MVNTTPRPLYLRERPGTPCIGGWVGPCLDGCGKSRPPPGFDTRTVQSLASRCTDCVITAHVQNKDMINKFSTVRVMMAYREGRSTALSTFTISDGCRRSSSCSGHFTPGEITTSTNQVWSCGLRSRLVLLEREEFFAPREPNQIPSVVELVAQALNTQFQRRKRDTLHRSDPEFNSLNDFQCLSQTGSKWTLQTMRCLLNQQNVFHFITKPVSGGVSHVEQSYMNYSLQIRRAMNLVLYHNR